MNTSMNGVGNFKSTRSNNYYSCKPSPVKTNNYNKNNNNRYYSKSESTSPSWSSSGQYQQRVSPTSTKSRGQTTSSYSWSNGSVSPQKRYQSSQPHRHSPNGSDDSFVAVPNPFSTAKGYNDPPPAEVLPMPPTKWTTATSSPQVNNSITQFFMKSGASCKPFSSPSLSGIAIKA